MDLSTSVERTSSFIDEVSLNDGVGSSSGCVCHSPKYTRVCSDTSYSRLIISFALVASRSHPQVVDFPLTLQDSDTLFIL